MAFALRPVEDADTNQIVALSLRAWASVHASMAHVLGLSVNALVYPDWAASQERDVRDACSDPDTTITVAIEGGVILGFVSVKIDPSSQMGEMDMIAVDPAAQRQGIGHALAEHALTQMREAGCVVATVATGGDAGHAPARALYEELRFTPLPLVRYYREL
jgi:ribosomal protein S18 acetylase RimI-like enzyme